VCRQCCSARPSVCVSGARTLRVRVVVAHSQPAVVLIGTFLPDPDSSTTCLHSKTRLGIHPCILMGLTPLREWAYICIRMFTDAITGPLLLCVGYLEHRVLGECSCWGLPLISHKPRIRSVAFCTLGQVANDSCDSMWNMYVATLAARDFHEDS
jgi:hypothetical protein